MKTIRELYDETLEAAKDVANVIKEMGSNRFSTETIQITMLGTLGASIAQSILCAAEGLRREIHDAKESAWITLPCDFSRPHPMERADGSSVLLTRYSEFAVAIRSIARFCGVGEESTAVFFNNGDILYTSMPYHEVHVLITGEPVDRKTVY